MAKVKFDEVKIYEWHQDSEVRKFCYAYMDVNNNRIPVQIQKASNKEWIAISLITQTLHLLTATENNTMEDWFESNEAEIYDSVAKLTV
jgi:hypothetical protein